MLTATQILFVVFETVPFVIFLSIILCLFCVEKKQEDTGRSGVGAAPARAAPPAAAPAPVVKLPYFPYSRQGKRESEKLVCVICLEVFQHGDTCSEVPACRHLFHGKCIAIWMKKNNSCPLCRVAIAAGSVAVSAADDMV